MAPPEVRYGETGLLLAPLQELGLPGLESDDVQFCLERLFEDVDFVEAADFGGGNDVLFGECCGLAGDFAQVQDDPLEVGGGAVFDDEQVWRGESHNGNHGGASGARSVPGGGFAFGGRQDAGDKRDAGTPAKTRRGSGGWVFGGGQIVVPLEFAFLLGAEVGEPVVVHDPRIDMRLGDLGDGHPFAQVEIAQLHQRRLFAADNDLAGGVADGEEALDGLPVGSRAGYLAFARGDEAPLPFVKQFAVSRLERQGHIDRFRRGHWEFADGEVQFDALFGVIQTNLGLGALVGGAAVQVGAQTEALPDGAPRAGADLDVAPGGAFEDFGLHLTVHRHGFIYALAKAPVGAWVNQFGAGLLVEEALD